MPIQRTLVSGALAVMLLAAAAGQVVAQNVSSTPGASGSHPVPSGSQLINVKFLSGRANPVRPNKGAYRLWGTFSSTLSGCRAYGNGIVTGTWPVSREFVNSLLR